MAKSVLICDDAAFMRVMIKDILTKNGYDVAGEAENGLKAVEKYNENKTGPCNDGYHNAGDGWYSGSEKD